MKTITVLVVVLKASLILGTALMAVCLAARARAAIRHLILAAAFVALLILPAAMRLLPDRVVSLPVARSERTAAVVAETPRESTAVIADEKSLTAPRRVALSVDTVIEGLWAAGMFVSLIPLLVGARELRRIRRAAVPWDAGATLLADLHADHRLGRRVSFLLHPDVPGPVTFGVVRPAIVFPPDARQWAIGDVRRAAAVGRPPQPGPDPRESGTRHS